MNKNVTKMEKHFTNSSTMLHNANNGKLEKKSWRKTGKQQKNTIWNGDLNQVT